MSNQEKRNFVAVVAVTLAGFAPSAFAYLDPSTGSMILSAIVGLFATAGLALKTYWYKFKSMFSGNKQEDQSLAAESSPTEPVDGGDASR